MKIQVSSLYRKINPIDFKESEKKFLEARADAIKILQAIKNYEILKKEESRARILLSKDFSSLREEIEKLNRLLPKREEQKERILRKVKTGKEKILGKKTIKRMIKEKGSIDPLEVELQEIQEQLKKL